MAENRLTGRLNGRRQMSGDLNNKYIPIYYAGGRTDTIEVVVDNQKKTIIANLLKGKSFDGAVRFDVTQALSKSEQARARLNINAVEANPGIDSNTEFHLVKYDSKGLVVQSRKIEKDDLPKVLNGQTFDGDVIFNGNVYQNGAAYELNGTKVLTKTDYIFMRDGAVSSLSDDEYTGLIANNYNGSGDYGALIYDKKGVARVGDVSFSFIAQESKPETLEKAYGYFYHDEATNKFRVIDGDFSEEAYEALPRVYKQKIKTNETQAIATRLEEGDADLVHNKLVIWDDTRNLLTAPDFSYEQTSDETEPSADDGELTYISSIEVDQNGRVSKTNSRKSTIKKSWRPVTVNGEEFLIATDGKTINFTDGSSISVLSSKNGNVTIYVNNKANAADRQENEGDAGAYQFLKYNTEGLITGKKATARQKKIKLSTAQAQVLLSTVYGTDGVDLILYGPQRQISTSNEKRYILGSARNDDMANTDVNNNVYSENGKLFSNSSEVINLADNQNVTGVKQLLNGLKIKHGNSIQLTDGSSKTSSIDIESDDTTKFNSDVRLVKNRVKTANGNYFTITDENTTAASTNTEQEITGKKTLSGELILKHNLDIASDNVFSVGSASNRLKEVYALQFKGNSTSADKVNYTLKYSSNKGETQEYDGSIARDLTDKVVDLFNEQTIKGKKTFSDETTINNNTSITGAVNIVGNLHISGDVVQEGKTYETHAEHLYTSKDVLVTRDGATTALGSDEYTGIVASKYDGTNDGGLLFDKKGIARVGDIVYNKTTGKIELTETQPLATREEAPLDKSIGFWNATTNRFETNSRIKVVDNKLIYNDSEVVNLADSQNITGEKKFSGGITLNSNITPSTDSSFNIGSADKKVNKIFVNTMEGNATSANRTNHKLILIGATDEDNVTFDGSVDYNLSDYYVDRFRAQEISGKKTFTEPVTIYTSSAEQLILQSNNRTSGYKDFEIFRENGSTRLRVANDFSIHPNGYSSTDYNTSLRTGYAFNVFGLYPTYNKSQSLGLSGNLWENLYLAGYLSDGSKTVTVANIVDRNTEQSISGKKSFTNTSNTHTVNSVSDDAEYRVLIGKHSTSNAHTLNVDEDALLYNPSKETLILKNIKIAGNVTDGVNTKTVKQIVDTVIKVGGIEDGSQANRIETISSGEQSTALAIDDNKNVNIPYATTSIGGVGKVNTSKGVYIDNGTLHTVKASNDEIDAETDNYKVITPSNLDYAVKHVGKDEYVDFNSDQTIQGKKTFNSQIIANAGANVTGDLTVNGNIYQSGSTYETHAEKVYSKKDYIYLREGASSSLSDGTFSGLEFIKYDGTNNGRLVVDKNGVARVGDVGDEQPLATREETPMANGYAKWDETNKRFKTINLTTLREEVGTSTTANTDKLLFPTYTSNGFINGIAKQVYNKQFSINGNARNIITDSDENLTSIYAADTAGTADGQILTWNTTTGKPEWQVSASAITIYDGLDQEVHQEGRGLSAHQGYVLDQKKVDKEVVTVSESSANEFPAATITSTIFNNIAKVVNVAGILEDEIASGISVHGVSDELDVTSRVDVGPYGVYITTAGVTPEDSFGADAISVGLYSTSLVAGGIAGMMSGSSQVSVFPSGVVLVAPAEDNVNGTVELALDATSFYPGMASTLSLGTKECKFKDLYLSNNLSDGTNSITVANIANKSQVPQVADYRNIS